MQNLTTSLSDKKEVIVTWGTQSFYLWLRGTTLPTLVFLLALIPWLQTFVDKDRNLVIPQSALRSIFLTFGLFLISMAVTPETWPGVMYLCLTGVGMLCLLWGGSRLIPIEDLLFPTARQILGNFFATTRLFFYAIPPSLLLLSGFILHLGVTSLLSNVFFGRIPQDTESTLTLMRAMELVSGKTVPVLASWESWIPRCHVYLLALGVWLGSPWILNPIIGALTQTAIYLAAREIYDDKTARVAALLYLLSPLGYLMSSQFISHVPTLFIFCVLIYFYARALKGRGAVSTVGALTCFGLLILFRPLTALGLTVPFTLVALVRTLISRPRPHVGLTAGMLAMSLALVYLGSVTHARHGSAFLFADDLPVLKTLQSGVKIKEPVTSVQDYEKEKALSHLATMNLFLFQWPLPSLIFVLLLFLLGSSRQFDYLLGASFVTLSLAAAFHPLPRLAFGPYLVYESVGAILILTARGMMTTQTHLAYRFRRRLGTPAARSLLALGVLFLLALSLKYTYPPLINYFHGAAFGFRARALF